MVTRKSHPGELFLSSHRAHILAATADRAIADAVAGRLVPHGYGFSYSATAEDALYQARAARPDIVMSMEPLQGDAVALGARLLADSRTSDASRVLMVDRLDGPTAKTALDAGFHDIIERNASDDVLLARLEPLRRASTMHLELRQRAGTALVMGVSVPGKLARGTAPEVELLFHDAAPALLKHFAQDGRIVNAPDLFDAESRLDDESFDAAILNAGEDAELALSLCRRVRNNPRLHNLPVVLLADPSRLKAAEAYGAGVSLFLPARTGPDIVRPAVLAFARRHHEWRALDRALGATLSGPTRDDATGVYSRTFFEAYLEGRVAMAHGADRPLTLLLLHFPSVGALREEWGPEAASWLEYRLGTWIDSLLRIEDLTAYLGESQYCVVLPDTTGEEADTVSNRVTGVLKQTDFAIPDVFRPIRAAVEAAQVTLGRGETGEDMLRRARQALG